MDNAMKIKVRNKIREELKIKDSFVVGHNLYGTYDGCLEFLNDEFEVIDAGVFIEIRRKK